MAAPKVSVCVITYNQEKYIGRCLESIVNQETDFAFEVIVGDDCSTDGTRAVVEEFVGRYPEIVRPIYQEKNTGGARNYMEVHAAAVGRYVAHVDGDDYALPGKLQAQADLLDAKPGCTAVWHLVDYFDGVGDFRAGRTVDISLFPRGRVTFSQAARLGFVGVHSSLMYPRAFRTPMSSDEVLLDLFFTWDLLSKGDGHFIADVVGRYRMNTDGSLSEVLRSHDRILSVEHAEYFVKRFPSLQKDFFLWAVCKALIEARHLRRRTFGYLLFALGNISFVMPWEIVKNLRDMKRLQPRRCQRRSDNLMV